MMKAKWIIAVAGIVAVGFGVWHFFGNTPQRSALLNRQLATHELAAFLARQFPGQRALVISNPFTQQPGLEPGVYAQERAGLDGLRAGFGKAVAIEAVVFPALKPEARGNPLAVLADKDTTTPLSYLVTDDAFDRLAEQHPKCRLLVSLVGLPAACRDLRTWQPPGAPRFALLFPDFRMFKDPEFVREATRSGKLAGFVLRRPDALSDAVAPGSHHAEEFRRRFVLVTATNIDEVIRRYPQYF